MVTMVLLNEAFTCATPALMFLRSRRRTRVVSVFAILSSGRSQRCPTRKCQGSSTESTGRSPGASLLLLAGDRLGRTLAGAGIGMGALPMDRKAATVAQATVVAQVHQALDVHRRVAAKVALDRVVPIDGLTNLNDLRVGEFVHAALGRDRNLLTDFSGHLRADPVNVLQCDQHALIRRDVDASNTSHA